MNIDFLIICFVLLGVLLSVLMNIIALQIFRNLSFWISTAFSILIANALLGILCYVRFPNFFMKVVPLGAFGVLISGYIYFHLLNMTQTSRRMRLMESVILDNLTRYEQLSNIYEQEAMLEMRLKRLLSARQIAFDGSSYIVTGKFLLLGAKVSYILSRLFGYGWSALDNNEI